MKKFVVIASVLIAVCHAEDPQEKSNRIIGECLQQSGASPDDIAPIMSRVVPTKREAKCFLACYHTAVGYQSPDGKISVDGTWAIGEKIKSNSEESFAKFKTIADTCIAEVKDVPDPCDNAANLMTCYARVQQEVGITMSEVMV